MPAIRSASEIAAKWSRVTPGRASDYAAGIAAPKKDWLTQTKAAEQAYESGVSTAIGEKRFGKGVVAAGTEKWKAKATAIGVPRWPTGVSAGVDSYEKGMGPVVDIIARTTLPLKGAKGDPGNIERVRILAQALHALKSK